MSVKILSIVDARPQLIIAVPVSRILRQVREGVLVHTGQHYDHNMSQVFFDDLDIPRPDVCLGLGSGSRAQQTARVTVAFDSVVLEQTADGGTAGDARAVPGGDGLWQGGDGRSGVREEGGRGAKDDVQRGDSGLVPRAGGGRD